jgi:NhaP-type Na+/H+ or K+/H+ antiporter
LRDSIIQWTNIDPELIIYAFLPALLFGEAQTLNLLQVKKVFSAASLLALPGACFVAWLLAICIKHVFGFDWDWGLCWLVGSILCATDPVAVVAVLKNIASTTNSQKRLTYMIVGEALINDGSALVLFGIIGSKSANSLQGTATVYAFAIYFIRVLFISPTVGAAIGFAATFCMRFFDRRLKSADLTIQPSITIICAYLSFFIAQYNLQVSGVISCCAAGLVVSYHGGPLVLNHEVMETVWRIFEWTGNTIVFLLSGLIVGSRSQLFRSPQAVWSIFAMYLALMVTRGILLGLLHFPITWLVPEYSWRHAVFSCFSGLRGGVSLCLALFLYSHSESYSELGHGEDLLLWPAHQIDAAAFMVCWSTALTIIVNGSLVPTVLSWLGLAPTDNHHDSIMVHYVEARLRLSMVKEYLRLKAEFPLHDPNFGESTIASVVCYQPLTYTALSL